MSSGHNNGRRDLSKELPNCGVYIKDAITRKGRESNEDVDERARQHMEELLAYALTHNVPVAMVPHKKGYGWDFYRPDGDFSS